MNFHTAALFIGFLIGNVLHTLVVAYQFVQVRDVNNPLANKFPTYGAFFKSFAIPVIVRMTIQTVVFGIFLQNPSLTNWAVNLLHTLLGSEANISMTGLSAFIVGFMADTIFAVLAQKYGSKYPWLVAQIPQITQDVTCPNCGKQIPATPAAAPATA
jgi:hypothetical protein